MVNSFGQLVVEEVHAGSQAKKQTTGSIQVSSGQVILFQFDASYLYYFKSATIQKSTVKSSISIQYNSIAVPVSHKIY